MTKKAIRTRSFWTVLVALTTLSILVLVGIPGVEPAETASSMDAPELPPLSGSETAFLTDAPLVPPPITRDYATRVVVDLETVEVKKEIAPGVEYTVWTFGGSVPG